MGKHLMDGLVLAANPATRGGCLATRRKKLGKLPEALRKMLDYHDKQGAGSLQQPQAVRLDTSKPLEITAQAILNYAETHR